jgi:hypothetical protein
VANAARVSSISGARIGQADSTNTARAMSSAGPMADRSMAFGRTGSTTEVGAPGELRSGRIGVRRAVDDQQGFAILPAALWTSSTRPVPIATTVASSDCRASCDPTMLACGSVSAMPTRSRFSSAATAVCRLRRLCRGEEEAR